MGSKAPLMGNDSPAPYQEYTPNQARRQGRGCYLSRTGKFPSGAGGGGGGWSLSVGGFLSVVGFLASRM